MNLDTRNGGWVTRDVVRPWIVQEIRGGNITSRSAQNVEAVLQHFNLSRRTHFEKINGMIRRMLARHLPGK